MHGVRAEVLRGPLVELLSVEWYTGTCAPPTIQGREVGY